MDNILSYDRNSDIDLYQILGCNELSTEEQILAEYKAHVLNCHPDKNPDDKSAVDRFQALSKAKEILTNQESRAKYDRWRRSGIAMSYDDWCALRGAVHTSMHWSTKAPQPSIIAAEHHEAENSSVTASPAKPMSSIKAEEPSKRERSPSPRQNFPYDMAQHINLTSPSKGNLCATDHVSWTPCTATGLLHKFRNYEI